jgi:sugar O-acyltransferase (sialic acid O-acetyltransferase NeuD family)
MTLLLVGAGGHARAIAEMLTAAHSRIDGYVDPRANDWLEARHLPSEADVEGVPGGQFVLGVGGISLEQLSRRLALFRTYVEHGWKPRSVFHGSAVVSEHAAIGEGCTVLARTVVQPAVRLGVAVIVNTGAIVEHDSTIGDGSHLAPGAIVLGGCKIGATCMIGAGAIVLPGAHVPDQTLVQAGCRFPK